MKRLSDDPAVRLTECRGGRIPEIYEPEGQLKDLVIDSCIFLGTKEDGSEVIEFETGPGGMPRVKSFKMIGWQCFGPNYVRPDFDEAAERLNFEEHYASMNGGFCPSAYESEYDFDDCQSCWLSWLACARQKSEESK